MGTSPVQKFLKKQVERLPEGPTDEQRAASRAILIGEATDAAGNVVRTRLETPEGYTLTADTGLEIARRAAAGDFQVGFQTPSNAYGADLITSFDDVRREDLNA